MVQQAFEYEKEHKVKLAEFYECVPKMKTKLVRGWAEELLAERNNFINTV
jgi:hypothetical protein